MRVWRLIFPESRCRVAPKRALISGEAVCWIAESPLVGLCSYLQRSTTFRQLVAKGGTLGWSAVACHVLTSMDYTNICRLPQKLRVALLCPWGSNFTECDSVEKLLGVWGGIGTDMTQQKTVPLSDTAASTKAKTCFMLSSPANTSF